MASKSRHHFLWCWAPPSRDPGIAPQSRRTNYVLTMVGLWFYYDLTIKFPEKLCPNRENYVLTMVGLWFHYDLIMISTTARPNSNYVLTMVGLWFYYDFVWEVISVLEIHAPETQGTFRHLQTSSVFLGGLHQRWSAPAPVRQEANERFRDQKQSFWNTWKVPIEKKEVSKEKMKKERFWDGWEFSKEKRKVSKEVPPKKVSIQLSKKHSQPFF